MPSHGTASSERNQFVNVLAPVAVALAAALDGLDPKEAIIRAGNGQALRNHLRQFFASSVGESKLLRPRYIVPIPQVPVNYDRTWEEAIAAGGPNTLDNHDIRKVGYLYVARRSGMVLTNITLVYFDQSVESEQVLEFGQEWKLGRVMNPWECFAISEHRPNLHRELGLSAMAAASLEKCDFRGKARVPYVWWGDAGREAGLVWFTDRWPPRYWFGFVRE